MATQNSTQNNFTFKYRAICKTCHDYIGQSHNTREEAVQDCDSHKAIDENANHNAQVEVTQTYHISSN